MPAIVYTIKPQSCDACQSLYHQTPDLWCLPKFIPSNPRLVMPAIVYTIKPQPCDGFPDPNPNCTLCMHTEVKSKCQIYQLLHFCLKLLSAHFNWHLAHTSDLDAHYKAKLHIFDTFIFVLYHFVINAAYNLGSKFITPQLNLISTL